MWLSSTQPTTHQMLRPRAICSSSGICQVRSIVRRVFPLATATSTSNNVSHKVFCRFHSNFYCFIRRYGKIARTFFSTQLLNTVDRLRVIIFIHIDLMIRSHMFFSHIDMVDVCAPLNRKTAQMNLIEKMAYRIEFILKISRVGATCDLSDGKSYEI